MDSSTAEVAFPIIFFLIFGVIGIACFALWLWSLIHCIKNKELSDNNRIIGVILIALLGILGSLIYLFLPRDQVPRDYRT